MWEYFKSKSTTIILVLVTAGFLVFAYSCEPKVTSLWENDKRVNRQELQLELDQLISLAQIRMADLDKQEEIRTIILQNAMVLVQGQSINPLGIITAVAALYGITQGGSNITRVVKETRKKRKENNA